MVLTQEHTDFLNKVCKGKWEIFENSINAKCDVHMYYMNLTKIPIKFFMVTGNFNCNNNQLTTLENSPSIILNNFHCENNNLTTLEHGPKDVNGNYVCTYNQLTDLVGAPKKCNTDYVFSCNNNKLTSLEGCPSIIKSELWCLNNPDLHILYGIGNVKKRILYEYKNDLNNWIIEQAKTNIFVTDLDIVRWIKDNNKLQFLLKAPQKIRRHFSTRILHLVDMGTYHNESKILDYKNFSRLC